MSRRLLAASILAATLACIVPPAAMAQSGGMVMVPNDDPEMAAAIAKARTQLPVFWKALEKPGAGEDRFALKVAIKDGADVEHFWLIDVAREGDKYVGTINNQPEIVNNVSAGERYTFADADISDWMFMRNDKIVGNETMRPLLKRLPKAQADEYRAMYAAP
jgi:uncharacterized protein YegJ (DUF2314 family)